MKKIRTKKVNGWAAVTKRGAFILAAPQKGQAASQSYIYVYEARLVPCTITYSISTKI